jgi:hypothetical protein
MGVCCLILSIHAANTEVTRLCNGVGGSAGLQTGCRAGIDACTPPQNDCYFNQPKRSLGHPPRQVAGRATQHAALRQR